MKSKIKSGIGSRHTKSVLPPVTVVATIGPASQNAATIQTLLSLGRILFRVNGAHGSIDEIGRLIGQIHKTAPDAPIMLDLPGRKIRTTRITKTIELRPGRRIHLARNQFTQPVILRYLKRGQILIVNDGRSRLRVESTSRDGASLVAETDGFIGNNKGIHVGAALASLPLFSPRDESLLDGLREWPATHIGLSFVCTPEDIYTARKALDKRRINAVVIPKIETSSAMINLPGILRNTEDVILDRGDLASEIGIENLPSAQDRILRETTAARVKLIVATQLLKSMEHQPIPLIAELTEIHRLLCKGVFGLQLSEETAVGKHPVGCVRLIMEMSQRIVAG